MFKLCELHLKLIEQQSNTGNFIIWKAHFVENSVLNVAELNIQFLFESSIDESSKSTRKLKLQIAGKVYSRDFISIKIQRASKLSTATRPFLQWLEYREIEKLLSHAFNDAILINSSTNVASHRKMLRRLKISHRPPSAGATNKKFLKFCFSLINPQSTSWCFFSVSIAQATASDGIKSEVKIPLKYFAKKKKKNISTIRCSWSIRERSFTSICSASLPNKNKVFEIIIIKCAKIWMPLLPQLFVCKACGECVKEFMCEINSFPPPARHGNGSRL